MPEPALLLDPSSLSNSNAAARGMIPRCAVSITLSFLSRVRWQVKHTHNFGISLVSWARGAHCVRLSSARLAVGKNGDIVALNERMDAVCNIFKDALLVNVLVKDTVKDEDLLASSRIYSQARG